MFLTTDDLNSTLYPEIQAAISRGETDTVDAAISDAMAVVQSKLAARYDIVAEFQKTGNDRNGLLVRLTKNIAVYYLYDLPETMPAKRAKAYDDAIVILTDLAKGTSILPGVNAAPTPTDSNENAITSVDFGSNPIRRKKNFL